MASEAMSTKSGVVSMACIVPPDGISSSICASEKLTTLSSPPEIDW